MPEMNLQRDFSQHYDQVPTKHTQKTKDQFYIHQDSNKHNRAKVIHRQRELALVVLLKKQGIFKEKKNSFHIKQRISQMNI